MRIIAHDIKSETKIRREITMPLKEAVKNQSRRNNQLRRQKADREATVSAIVTGIIMVAMPFCMVASYIMFGY